MVQTLKEMKTGKVLRPSEASLELNGAIQKVTIQAMVEFYEGFLYGMPAKLALIKVVQIMKGKADIIEFQLLEPLSYLSIV